MHRYQYSVKYDNYAFWDYIYVVLILVLLYLFLTKIYVLVWQKGALFTSYNLFISLI